ncbi:MAG: PEGA domain-containing protein [bacterium]
MKKIYRQLLLFSSSVVFMAIAPLLIFYAMGYRVGISDGDTLPVGVLIVETNPRRASISIDGKVIGDTPYSISNLPPGEVMVSLSHDGYITWLKRLLIESTVVSELRDVRLFPAEPKTTTIFSRPDSFSLSPNRQLLAIITPNRELHIIDEEALPVIAPIKIRFVPTRLLWSPDSSRVLLIDDKAVSFVNITDRTPLDRPLSALKQTRQITWDLRIPGRLLAINNANELIAYNIATNASVKLAEKVHTFATSSRHIYVVEQKSQQIQVYNLQGQQIATISPAADQIIDQLFATPGGHMAIEFTDTSLAVLDEGGQLLPVADRTLHTGWSPNGQILYVQTDETSVHVYNALDERLSYVPMKQLHLVLRLSRPIRSPQWFAGGHHLIYQADDEIVITEIDTRDHPISYTVDSTNLGDSLVTVGQEGDNIFYIKNTPAGTQLVTTSLVIEE